ncbi:uncharacterized protein LOC134817823 [Bolinopsis microptera]|uniref:uncharacterized protein LOC134817823 n=1 Tax=Bolinopsis microptera TaxID=2820187 RepID=UPI0030794CEA
MTSPDVESAPPAIRSQCTRAGVIAKYYRRNSGDVESSPLYSAWFREEIIADQRFERRRKLLSLNRARDCYNEMEVEYSDKYWSNARRNSRPSLRGKRQADCKICHTELTDWSLVTSPSHVTPPSLVTPLTCFHLFHTSCYQYWHTKSKSPEDGSCCPVCVKINTSFSEAPTPDDKEDDTVVISPVVLQPIPLVLRDSLLLVTSETLQEVLTETEGATIEVTGVTQIKEKEEKEVVVLEI